MQADHRQKKEQGGGIRDGLTAERSNSRGNFNFLSIFWCYDSHKNHRSKNTHGANGVCDYYQGLGRSSRLKRLVTANGAHHRSGGIVREFARRTVAKRIAAKRKWTVTGDGCRLTITRLRIRYYLDGLLFCK